MPKHIVRLLLLIGCVGAAAYAAKLYFTADSFFQFGHYRGNSPSEIALAKPKYQGSESCKPCHAAQYTEWSTGVHNSASIGKAVKCEICHGAGAGRDDAGNKYVYAATGPEHPRNLKLEVPADTAKLCTLCHEQMPARPLEQKQIAVAAHAGGNQCKSCHNVHSPKTIVAGAAPNARHGDAAAGAAKAVVCAACHGAGGVSAGLPGPNLAGQKEAYLAEALKAYRSGARADPMMGGMAKALSDTEVEDLAAYFAGSKCEDAARAGKANAARAPAVAAKCAACHGATGISPNPLWPNLAGQSRPYLQNALNAYKLGTRSNGFMGPITKDLNDADAEAAAAYFSGASCR